MHTLLLTMLIAVGSFVAAQPPSKIPVYVKSAADADGFTDPSKDRQDSVKDLTKKVKDSKLLVLVPSADQAVIVLEVLGRGTNREVNGWAAVNGQAQNKSFLTVKLTAGEFSTEFTGQSGSKGILTGHGAAAGKVVDQLEDWVKANREKLVTLAPSR